MSVVVWLAVAASGVWILVNLATYAWRANVLRSLRSCDRPALPLAAAVRAFLFEVVASALARLSPPITDHRTPNTGHQDIVILIHDFGLGAGSFRLLRRRLERAGWQTVALRHGRRRGDARTLAAELRSCIETIDPARQVVLLGHGFGGLIARLYGRDYGPLRVRRIVTLGTPHRGSVLSPLHGPLRSMLQPRGRLLAYLEASDPVPQQFDVITLCSPFDAFVLPPANAEYAGAFNIQIAGVGHDALLFSAKVFELVAENLAVPIE